jgi:hypothetical protein
VLTKVAEELKEPDIPWQIALADTTKHSQVGLEQGEQTLRSILMDRHWFSLMGTVLPFAIITYAI